MLPLLAGAVLLLAITNPMKFDTTQRVTGSLALLFAACFVAHTIRSSQVLPVADFATAKLIAFILQDRGKGGRGLWLAGLYESSSGTVMTPIDGMAIIQIATKDKPVTLNSVSLELQTPHGWMPLRKLPPEGIRLFFGPPQNASEGVLDQPDLNTVLRHKIEPWETVEVFGVYLYGNPNFIPPTGRIGTVRITMTNAFGETVKIEVEETGRQSADPFASGQWKIRLNRERNIDLTKFKLQPFFPEK